MSQAPAVAAPHRGKLPAHHRFKLSVIAVGGTATYPVVLWRPSRSSSRRTPCG